MSTDNFIIAKNFPTNRTKSKNVGDSFFLCKKQSKEKWKPESSSFWEKV